MKQNTRVMVAPANTGIGAGATSSMHRAGAEPAPTQPWTFLRRFIEGRWTALLMLLWLPMGGAARGAGTPVGYARETVSVQEFCVGMKSLTLDGLSRCRDDYSNHLRSFYDGLDGMSLFVHHSERVTPYSVDSPLGAVFALLQPTGERGRGLVSGYQTRALVLSMSDSLSLGAAGPFAGCESQALHWLQDIADEEVSGDALHDALERLPRDLLSERVKMPPPSCMAQSGRDYIFLGYGAPRVGTAWSLLQVDYRNWDSEIVSSSAVMEIISHQVVGSEPYLKGIVQVTCADCAPGALPSIAEAHVLVEVKAVMDLSRYPDLMVQEFVDQFCSDVLKWVLGTSVEFRESRLGPSGKTGAPRPAGNP